MKGQYSSSPVWRRRTSSRRALAAASIRCSRSAVPQGFRVQVRTPTRLRPSDHVVRRFFRDQPSGGLVAAFADAGLLSGSAVNAAAVDDRGYYDIAAVDAALKTFPTMTRIELKNALMCEGRLK
jgi:hypothetical protein